MAVTGVTPKTRISIGVIREPPPMPVMPTRMPTPRPNATRAGSTRREPRAREPYAARQMPPGAGGVSPRIASQDHARTDGVVRRLVDEDEAAGCAVAPVLVHQQRGRQPQSQLADLVQLEAVRVLVAVERVHVDAVDQLVHLRQRGAARVLDPIAAGRR